MRRERSARGAVVVEFAIVFPLIILPMLLGIIQYGYHFWSLSTASATAREAARRLSVGTDQACTFTEARTQASFPAVGPVLVTQSPASPGVGQLVTVTVQFPSLDLKLLPLPGGGVVSQSAQSRIQTVRAGSAQDPKLPC